MIAMGKYIPKIYTKRLKKSIYRKNTRLSHRKGAPVTRKQMKSQKTPCGKTTVSPQGISMPAFIQMQTALTAQQPIHSLPVSYTHLQQNQRAKLCLGAVIAALYTVLTLALPVLSYGPIQFRLAEGMTVLAWLCPEAIPGLTLGCFLSNLIGSPYALDWIMGTLAAFSAALWTARVSKRWMAPIPPVLCNMVIIGGDRLVRD